LRTIACEPKALVTSTCDQEATGTCEGSTWEPSAELAMLMDGALEMEHSADDNDDGYVSVDRSAATVVQLSSRPVTHGCVTHTSSLVTMPSILRVFFTDGRRFLSPSSAYLRNLRVFHSLEVSSTAFVSQ
jgi:hypothetical protein